MRAVLCRAYGPADGLEVDTVPAPTAGQGEVIVAVHAAGVQFVDNRVVEGKSLLNTAKLNVHLGRPAEAGFPIIPGMEAAGIVEEVGEGVRSVKRGDRVLGTCLLGAFAEKARFRELEVCRIPDQMDMPVGGRLLFRVFHRVLLAHPPGGPEGRGDRAGARGREWRGTSVDGDCEGSGRTGDRSGFDRRKARHGSGAWCRRRSQLSARAAGAG